MFMNVYEKPERSKERKIFQNVLKRSQKINVNDQNDWFRLISNRKNFKSIPAFFQINWAKNR